MLEYFSDWMPVEAKLYKVVSTKNSIGQTVLTKTAIDGVYKFAKWVTASQQTDLNDKFVNNEIGKLAIAYRKFYIGTVEQVPDITWYAVIGGVKYFIDGIDNIGSMNETYVFAYHKDRI